MNARAAAFAASARVGTTSVEAIEPRRIDADEDRTVVRRQQHADMRPAHAERNGRQRQDAQRLQRARNPDSRSGRRCEERNIRIREIV